MQGRAGHAGHAGQDTAGQGREGHAINTACLLFIFRPAASSPEVTFATAMPICCSASCLYTPQLSLFLPSVPPPLPSVHHLSVHPIYKPTLLPP